MDLENLLEIICKPIRRRRYYYRPSIRSRIAGWLKNNYRYIALGVMIVTPMISTGSCMTSRYQLSMTRSELSCCRKEIKQLKKEYGAEIDENQSLQSSIEFIEREKKSLYQKISGAEAECKKLSINAEKIVVENKSLNLMYADLRKEYSDLLCKFNELNEYAGICREKNEQLDRAINDLEKEICMLSSKSQTDPKSAHDKAVDIAQSIEALLLFYKQRYYKDK